VTRDEINRACEELGVTILLADGLDDAFLGITRDDPPRAVYSYERVIDLLVEQGMTTAEAKELLLRSIDEEARQDANRRLYQIEQELRANSDRRAREILMQAMQRLNADVISETTTSVVPIPNEDMKGRIKREDASVPARDGLFAYYQRFEASSQHPIYCRVRSDGQGGKQLLLGKEATEAIAYHFASL